MLRVLTKIFGFFCSKFMTNGYFEDIKLGRYLLEGQNQHFSSLLITVNECKGFHIKV